MIFLVPLLAALSIGGRVSDLKLTALDGAPRAIAPAPATVLIFLSAQCPVSNEYVPRLNALAREYEGRATVLGVNSNRNESLDDARKHAAEYRLAFPVYKDPGNVLADLLGVTVTPQAVVLDSQRRLQYRGRIDDSQKLARVTRSDLRLALGAVLTGRPAPASETKAFGCTIKRADDEALELLDQAAYRSLIASHSGKVVLVDFWATWCDPCREEMPALVALERKLRGKGFVFIPISADDPGQTQTAAQFLARLGLQSPAYLKQAADDQGFINSVSPQWSGALPALFLYDRSGRLARSFIGEIKTSAIEREVSRLLR